MNTPQEVTDGLADYYAEYMVLLYDLEVPNTDPFSGKVGNEANAAQGLLDYLTLMLAHPPTGQEQPDPAEYQQWYDAGLQAIEYLRRLLGHAMEHP